MYKVMVVNQENIEYLDCYSDSISLQLYVLRSKLKRGSIKAWKIVRNFDNVCLAQSKAKA